MEVNASNLIFDNNEIKERNPRIERILSEVKMRDIDLNFGSKISLDYNTMEKEQADYNNFLASKLKEKCLNQIENFKKYSIISKKLSSPNELDYSPVKGKENEFSKTYEELEDCKKPYDYLVNDIKVFKDIYNFITVNSIDDCLDGCENLLRSLNVEEIKLQNCVSKCVQSSKYNYLTTNSLIKERYEYNKNLVNDKI